MNWKGPFFDLVLSAEEKQAVLNVMESNWLTAGPKIEEFEAAFSAVSDGEVQAVAVSSATAALVNLSENHIAKKSYKAFGLLALTFLPYMVYFKFKGVI
jgi:dTDP-4-amino-4,6-dideoxygalactose transaminase